MICLKYTASIFLFLIVFISPIRSQEHQVRIACIGGTATYGDKMQMRVHNAYPAQLQSILGNRYQVMNLGISESELLSEQAIFSKGETRLFKHKPDIIFILPSGTDEKTGDENFSFTGLVKNIQVKLPRARVIILLPLPRWDSMAALNPVTKNTLIPSLQQTAYETGCEVIDLYSLFVEKTDLFPDGIHMSSLGGTVIAKRLYEVVRLKEVEPINLVKKTREQKKTSSFYGYQLADFLYAGRECKLVRPKKAAQGMPWIWRARFWGHEPQTDIALLERGFHLVYCDVAELYGNSEAISIWNTFYDYMRTLGLSEKVVLEGMSRGGVYIYNWALANPAKVACIYADAPVLDLRSWPGGKGKGPGSPEDWELFKKDYNLNEVQASDFEGSPLQQARKIASLQIPMLHVVGDADEVVPVDENTNPFEAAIMKEGGDITVIHKAGGGHHPHSLVDPTLIVDFILRNTGYKVNFAALPAPGSEYRSGAGWVEGKGWWDNNHDINKLLAETKKLDILFIGNSITQGIGGNRPNVTYKPGLKVFDSIYKTNTWECAGISGDRTQHVLWRLQHGNYRLNNPKLLVLTIGVNNFPDDSPKEIAAGIKKILDWFKINMPASRVLLIGPLPAGVQPSDMLRKKYDVVQALIKNYGNNKTVFYLPMADRFIREDGKLDPDLCSADGIHLEARGYTVWAQAMKPVIEKLLAQ